MCEEHSSFKSPGGDQFVKRLFGLPIMAATIGQLSSFYSSTKERNRLLKLTLETAESGVGVIVSTAVPVVSRFDKEIVALNDIACAQLDVLEYRCPIITKPTDEVVKETRDLCCVAVQPVVNRVNSVKNYSYNKVSGIRTYTGDKINGMKTYGRNTVVAAAKVGSDQVTRVLSIPVCRGVVNRVDLALDIADRYVDDYLPSECGVETSDKKATSDVVLLSKAYQLGSKVQRRLYARTMKRLRGAQLRTRETLGQLNYTVDLIEYTRSSVNGAQDKLKYYWQEINKMDDQVTEDAANEQIGYYDSNFERKAIATARQLTTRLKSTFSWIGQSSVASVPEAVRGKLRKLQDLVHRLSEVFSKQMIRVKGLPNSALNSARNTMVQLYDSLSDLVEWTLKNSSSPNLISSLLGYGVSHGGSKHDKIDVEMSDVDSKSQQQKKTRQEANTENQAALEEDQCNEMTGKHQPDTEEDVKEKEEEEEKENEKGKEVEVEEDEEKEEEEGKEVEVEVEEDEEKEEEGKEVEVEKEKEEGKEVEVDKEDDEEKEVEVEKEDEVGKEEDEEKVVEEENVVEEEQEDVEEKEDEEAKVVEEEKVVEKEKVVEEEQEDEKEDEEENEDENEDEMEKNDEEEIPTNKCAEDCDPAEPDDDADESANNPQNDELGEDKNGDKTENQLNEDDVEDQPTGVADQDKGKDSDGCDDLEKKDSEAHKLNEQNID